MSKVAFICPVYDMRNHFDYAVELYQSRIENGINEDFYFVFSNKEQQLKLTERINKQIGEAPKSLVLPDKLLHYKSQINVKKLYALKKLKDDYLYLFVIDCESRFMRSGDFYEIAEEIWSNKSMLNATLSSDAWSLVLRSCFKALGLQGNITLLKETRGWQYNIWFNEIPTYRSDTLNDFFSWLEHFDKNKYLNAWACFDYHLYVAFLILEKGYHLIRHKNYKARQGYVEALNKISTYTSTEKIESLKILRTHWTSDSSITTNNTYLLCQQDRQSTNTTACDYGEGIRKYINRLVRVIYDIIGGV